MEFIVSETFRSTYPGSAAGILVMRDVENPAQHNKLAQRKAELEESLRGRFDGWNRVDLAALSTIRPYTEYMSRFKKTYHVQLQLESVVLKGRPLPAVAALVEAMFMAELKNQLLTAGHDLDAMQEPVRLDVANGTERYTLLNGQDQILKLGDMFMADGLGVISSVVYGPDQRTRLTPGTRRAFFAVYAPAGIEPAAVERHLADIQANVEVISSSAAVEMRKVYTV